MALFSEIFGEYLADQQLDALGAAEIERLEMKMEKRELCISVHSQTLLPGQLLAQVQKGLRDALQLKEAAILPHYPAALFSCDCLPELISILGNRGGTGKRFFWRLQKRLFGWASENLPVAWRTGLPGRDPLRAEAGPTSQRAVRAADHGFL